MSNRPVITRYSCYDIVSCSTSKKKSGGTWRRQNQVARVGVVWSHKFLPDVAKQVRMQALPTYGKRE